jgi:TRAP-type C4-dicarboxylate transport system permease small subunit
MVNHLKYKMEVIVWHKFSLFLSNIANGFVVILLGLMSIVILLGVFFRYVLIRPLPWSEDLGRYLMIWTALFGVGVVMQNKAHVAVTIFAEKMPKRVGLLLLLTAKILVFGFGLTMGYLGVQLLRSMMPQISPTLQISMTWVYGGFPFYGFFLMVSTLDQILEDIKQFRNLSTSSPNPPSRKGEG